MNIQTSSDLKTHLKKTQKRLVDYVHQIDTQRNTKAVEQSLRGLTGQQYFIDGGSQNTTRLEIHAEGLVLYIRDPNIVESYQKFDNPSLYRSWILGFIETLLPKKFYKDFRGVRTSLKNGNESIVIEIAFNQSWLNSFSITANVACFVSVILICLEDLISKQLVICDKSQFSQWIKNTKIDSSKLSTLPESYRLYDQFVE